MTLATLLTRLRSFLTANPTALGRGEVYVVQVGAQSLIVTGTSAEFASPPTSEVTCTIITDANTLVELARDPSTAMQALMLGRLKVSNAAAALRLGQVLAGSLRG